MSPEKLVQSPLSPADSEADHLPGPRVVNCLKIEAVVQPHRPTVLRTVEFEDPRDARRWRLGYSCHKRRPEDPPDPRHRHTFDQIRFVVAGHTRYGPLHLSDGDCVYFPEAVFYGPAETLSDEVTSCTIQTQGPTWGQFPNDAEVGLARERMRDLGTMDRAAGLFRWQDGRSQDSFEAMLQTHLGGGPVAYPAPRYHSPVLLRSRAFDWLVDADQPGVWRKPLASFNAGGPRISLLRIEAGARFSGGRVGHHRMLVVYSGQAASQSESYEEGTLAYLPPHALAPALEAEQPLEALLVEVEQRGQRLAS